MRSTPRTRKVSESVRAALADILSDEIEDPRVRFVTVTSVTVSPDLRQATVYFTAPDDPESYEAAAEGLSSASRRIRAALGKRVRIKYTPELRFRLDDSVDEGMRIARALKNVPPTLDAASDEATEALEDGDAARYVHDTDEEDTLP